MITTIMGRLITFTCSRKLPHLAVDAVKSNIVESRISTSGKGCSTIARSKKYRGGSRTLTTCKKELFVTLI